MTGKINPITLCRKAAVPAILLVGVLALPSGPSRAQTGRTYFFKEKSPLLRGLLAGDSGYLIGNPIRIAEPDVEQVSIAPNGVDMLAIQHRHGVTPDDLEKAWNTTTDNPWATDDEMAITVWNARTGHGRVLWHPAGIKADPDVILSQQQQLQLFGWFPKSSLAVALLATTNQHTSGKSDTDNTILIVDAARNVVHASPIAGTLMPLMSPKLPYAGLVDVDGDTFDQVRFIGPNGELTDPIKLPHYLSFTRWSEDGTVLRGRKDGDGGVEMWYAVDPVARTVTRIPTPPKDADGGADYGPDTTADPAGLPFRLTDKPGSDGSPRSVWLEATTGTEKLLLSAEGQPVAMMPDAALYRMFGGALYAAPITKIGRAALTRMSHDKYRSDALAAARPISGALMMVASASPGDLFPPADADLAKTLKGDLNDPNVLSAFTYQPLTGQRVTGGAQKAVPVGFVPTPVGRALVLSDGSAIWEEAVTPK